MSLFFGEYSNSVSFITIEYGNRETYNLPKDGQQCKYTRRRGCKLTSLSASVGDVNVRAATVGTVTMANDSTQEPSTYPSGSGKAQLVLDC